MTSGTTMAQAEPATFGAYGRSVQGGRDDESKDGLENLPSSSKSPPDVQPNTRMVAVCGITDYTRALTTPSSQTDSLSPARKLGTSLSKGQELLKLPSERKELKEKKEAESSTAQNVDLASLARDGWFLSDSYLFSSRCFPDMQPNTRIIGLCGITDYTSGLRVSIFQRH